MCSTSNAEMNEDEGLPIHYRTRGILSRTLERGVVTHHEANQARISSCLGIFFFKESIEEGKQDFIR